ncbi:MAG TPA: tyrosine protein phosphatase [Limnochordia bacterium]|nr:tyrosine protein phosphatase [Limnochordia bacterium]
MIDLHVHILPGVDDGPPTLEEALAMGRVGEERGLKVVAATPHFFGQLSWATVQQKVAELREEFARAQVSLELVAGAELMLDLSLLDLAPEEIPTYGGQGRFCLIEFPFQELPVYTDDVLFDLQTKGITPIIAHPERYRGVLQDPNTALGWLERGCLLQVNTGSILGRFGSTVQEAAEILLTHDMAQFVASDAHSVQRRTLDLPQAHGVLVELLGAERAEELVAANPRAVLAGDFAPRRPPQQYRRKRRFFSFRRFS